MSGERTAYLNARLLDPASGLDAPGALLVQDGRIADLGPDLFKDGAPSVGQVVDCEGLCLAPGLVDMRVQLREPGEEHKETIHTASAAAAAGGVTTMVSLPNTHPVIDDVSVVEFIARRAQEARSVNVRCYGSVTRGLRGEELTEMAELRAEGAIAFTDDGMPVTSAGVLRKALQYQRLAGGLIALHEEDPALSGRGAMHEGELSALLGVAGIPSVSESTMVARDCALAGYEGARIHIQHLSCIESVLAIETAKAQGVQVTCEASPHHLCLTDDAVRSLDTRMKMNPPLRTEDDRQALIEGLRSGAIDCIATDHAPHARDEKEVPFEQAPMGTTGLETAFAAVYTHLVAPGVLDLGLVVERMTSGGEAFGIPAPRIGAGEEANLVLVDLAAEWEVGENGYESRSDNCCFGGQRLRGRVLLTVAAGAVAYRERAFAVVSA